ncbi:DUF3866 family protein [Brevibacillus massiliensis]|uniref:DUF3866 family protein n=1 Tax=Brevibacillus massiliensis TaxID=1118054 RepID=UPI00030554A0|nr:DUF3866 family protein [Brevibacillus massiliensis]
MLRLAVAKVVEIVAEREGMQTLDVVMTATQQRESACFFTSGAVKCAPGELVLLNTTSVELGLGTGGCHFVVARLNPDESRVDDLHPTAWGHVMKMRYTPLQLAVDSVEEQGSPHHSLFCDESVTLERTPVVIGELHSMLPSVALAIKQLQPDCRIVYVMPDGASLPIAFSRHVALLKHRGILSATVTTGHAWGGDFDAVNLHTGLLAAKHLAAADVILCMLGPGVVGTGTNYGFSGMQTAEAVHAASCLEGVPVFVPRIGFADPRERHHGMSHHTRTVLKRFALAPVLYCVPRFGDHRDSLLARQEQADSLSRMHHRLLSPAPDVETIARLQHGYPLTITTMGRDLTEEPSPLQTCYVAAELALHALVQRHLLSVLPPGQDALAILAASWDSRPSREA